MALKDKLPVSYLLFTTRGRIDRLTYWTASIFIWSSFYVLFHLLEYISSYTATLLIYPPLFWALISTATKRLHDNNRTGWWLLLSVVPVLGPLVLFYFLACKKGNSTSNRYGAAPGSATDYFKNGNAERIPESVPEKWLVNDVTQLNPVLVSGVAAPETIAALQILLKNTNSPVSIGGGRFSMGGQTASANHLHIDLRKMNAILDFSAKGKWIKVEAGARWCDIQSFLDRYDLSVKIMQTYANFTVGGSLSVNCHGRYIGLGAVILSVKSVEVMMADGTIREASKELNESLFYAVIGCFNAVGVIVTAVLEVTENCNIKRVSKKIKRKYFKDFFFERVKGNEAVVLHNTDIYPPNYTTMRAVSWIKTQDKPTVKTRLMPLAAAYPIEQYFISAFSRSHFGKWRREYLIDPLLFSRKKVHPRNYEAGYDVAELEPKERKKTTYVLQEYFIPVAGFDAFSELMTRVFKNFRVNVINVSIRHAEKDPGSLLAWAEEEVFSFVVWYRQKTDEVEKNKVGVWTRALVDAAISLKGSYYLPYQPHATNEQFHRAYPNAGKLLELKKQMDPHYKFRNILWEKYYKQTL